MRKFSAVRAEVLRVRVNILKRGKKKKIARKERGRSQRMILFCHRDTGSAEILNKDIRVSVSPWLIDLCMG
jgi:hypothetical protein